MRKTNKLTLFAIGLAVAVAAPVAAQESQTKPRSSNPSTETTTQEPGSQPGTAPSGKKGATASQQQSTAGGKSTTSSSRDHSFLRKAAQNNVNEVQSARMAEDRSTNQGVKDFAKRLETDHTNVDQQIASIARTEGITVASVENMGGTSGTSKGAAAKSTTGEATGGSSSASYHAHMGKLANLSGAEFDREWVRMQVRDHEKDIKEYERASNDPKMSSDVRNLAQQTLPTLREHLQMARSLESQMGGTSGKGMSGTTQPSGTTGEKKY